jgi:hypothetical protein
MKPLGWKNQIASPHRATSRIPGAPGQNKTFLIARAGGQDKKTYDFQSQERFFS